MRACSRHTRGAALGATAQRRRHGGQRGGERPTGDVGAPVLLALWVGTRPLAATGGDCPGTEVAHKRAQGVGGTPRRASAVQARRCQDATSRLSIKFKVREGKDNGSLLAFIIPNISPKHSISVSHKVRGRTGALPSPPAGSVRGHAGTGAWGRLTIKHVRQPVQAALHASGRLSAATT